MHLAVFLTCDVSILLPAKCNIKRVSCFDLCRRLATNGRLEVIGAESKCIDEADLQITMLLYNYNISHCQLCYEFDASCSTKTIRVFLILKPCST